MVVHTVAEAQDHAVHGGNKQPHEQVDRMDAMATQAHFDQSAPSFYNHNNYYNCQYWYNYNNYYNNLYNYNNSCNCYNSK